jgi:hypothetical protein
MPWDTLMSAVVFVEVETPKGDRAIGTAFHIGNGCFATARHNIDGNTILKIGQSDMSLKTHIGPSGDTSQVATHPGFEVPGTKVSIFRHPDASVDVALLQLTEPIEHRGNPREMQPVIGLADHVNLLSQGELLMEEVRVFGYPRIPFSMDVQPPLVTFPGEIAAVFQNWTDKQRHFNVSCLARAGFSGGPVILVGSPNVQSSAQRMRNNSTTAVGIVVNSLETYDTSNPTAQTTTRFEPGITDVISIETVRDIVRHHSLSTI